MVYEQIQEFMRSQTNKHHYEKLFLCQDFYFLSLFLSNKSLSSLLLDSSNKSSNFHKSWRKQVPHNHIFSSLCLLSSFHSGWNDMQPVIQIDRRARFPSRLTMIIELPLVMFHLSRGVNNKHATWRDCLSS